MTLLEEVKNKIEENLDGAKVEVIDQSEGHEEHGSTGAHLGVSVTYSGFKGMNKVEQHQLIYKIVQEELKEKIHALVIKTQEE